MSRPAPPEFSIRELSKDVLFPTRGFCPFPPFSVTAPASWLDFPFFLPPHRITVIPSMVKYDEFYIDDKNERKNL